MFLHTTEHLPLMVMLAGFTLISIALWIIFHKMSKQALPVRNLKNFYGETEIVLPHELIRRTKDKDKGHKLNLHIPDPDAKMGWADVQNETLWVVTR